MNTKLILVLAFLVALVLDVVITIILKKKKKAKEDDFLVDFIYDEDLDYDDELDEYEDDYIEEDKEDDEPSVSSILNKLIPKKEKEFKDLRIDLEEQKAPEPIENDWLDEDLRYIDNHYEIDVLLKVSRGFYIRSLARDLGLMLDGCAIVKELRRISTGGFNIDKAISIDEINETKLITIEEFFDFPKVIVDDYIAKLVKNGVELDERQTTISGNFYVCDKFGIIAIYEEKENNKYKPVLIF